MSEITNRGWFTELYKDQIFTLWYSMGKPVARVIYPKVPVTEDGQKPSYDTIHTWIRGEDFKERAAILDEQVLAQVNEKMIAEKVEMLNRHAGIGATMQDMAIEYLEAHKEDLGTNSAVRLLIAGVEIERESRGIATTVEKISKMSDSELENEIQKLITRSQVEFLPEGDDASITDEQ